MSLREELTGWPYESRGISLNLSKRKLIAIVLLILAVAGPPLLYRATPLLPSHVALMIGGTIALLRWWL